MRQYEDDMLITMFPVMLIVWVFFLSYFFVDVLTVQEKVTVTILDAKEDSRIYGRSYLVVYCSDGEVYRTRDFDLYYLYKDRIGETFPAVATVSFVMDIETSTQVDLLKDYGTNWEVNSLLYKHKKMNGGKEHVTGIERTKGYWH